MSSLKRYHHTNIGMQSDEDLGVVDCGKWLKFDDVMEAKILQAASRYESAIAAKEEFLKTATPEQAGRGFIAWCEERLITAIRCTK